MHLPLRRALAWLEMHRTRQHAGAYSFRSLSVRRVSWTRRGERCSPSLHAFGVRWEPPSHLQAGPWAVLSWSRHTNNGHSMHALQKTQMTWK